MSLRKRVDELEREIQSLRDVIVTQGKNYHLRHDELRSVVTGLIGKDDRGEAKEYRLSHLEPHHRIDVYRNGDGSGGGVRITDIQTGHVGHGNTQGEALADLKQRQRGDGPPTCYGVVLDDDEKKPEEAEEEPSSCDCHNLVVAVDETRTCGDTTGLDVPCTLPEGHDNGHASDFGDVLADIETAPLRVAPTLNIDIEAPAPKFRVGQRVELNTLGEWRNGIVIAVDACDICPGAYQVEVEDHRVCAAERDLRAVMEVSEG